MTKAIKRAIALLLLTHGSCTGAAEMRARTALEVIGQAGESAYTVTQDQCRHEQVAYAAIGDLLGVNASLARCQGSYNVFDKLGELQREAVDAVDRGDVQKAQELLAEASTLWAALRGGK